MNFSSWESCESLANLNFFKKRLLMDGENNQVLLIIYHRNPSAARHAVFQEVYPLIEKFLPYEKPSKDRHAEEATNDRLIHLLIKGYYYKFTI